MNSTYITSAAKAEQLPVYDWPEIAFVGRSNCGKSSLLNALLNRKNLARASSTPGRTQMVNFFGITKGENQVIFADLPGYGFSAIGRHARKPWEELMGEYLVRPNIREILFLADIRREPDDEDIELLTWLGRNANRYELSVVLTKADKLNQSETAKAVAKLKKIADAQNIKTARVLAVSTLKNKGIPALQEKLLSWLDEPAAT
jgi:GTP-binding protein